MVLAWIIWKRDTGYTLVVYDKVRQDPMEIIKMGKPYEKGKIIIYKGTQQYKKCNSKFMASLNFFVWILIMFIFKSLRPQGERKSWLNCGERNSLMKFFPGKCD